MATDRTERLLNLVICLLGARRPISRATLRERIPGYGDAPSGEAFERMFERDKEELRQMGIPIDTVVNVQGEVEGYRIDQDSYAMPPLHLDAAEMAVLGLAAHAWNEAALASQASAALRKIEAGTGEIWAPPPLVDTRPHSGDESLPVLWEAIRTRSPVRFTYLARGRESAEERTVEPWATVYRNGAWYLVGHSREREAARAFRLSRLTGEIKVLREECAPADRRSIEEVIESISEPAAQGSAVVHLPESGAARLKQRARHVEGTTWEIEYADEGVLVSEVIESGGRILRPDDVTRRHTRALQRVVEVHGG